MERTYILHLKEGNKIVSLSEAIANAEDQKKRGIAPHYAFMYDIEKEEYSNPGWLVWSTWEDGAGVVVPRNDGTFILLTGWQSDFAYI